MSVRILGQTPPCCKGGGKCVNDPPFTWPVVAGSSGSVVNNGSGGLLITGTGGGVGEIILDSGVTVKPNQNFCYSGKVQRNSGSVFVGLKIIGSDNQDIMLENSGSGWILDVSGHVGSVQLNTGVTDNLITFTVCRKGTLITVTVNGVVNTINVTDPGINPSLPLSPYAQALTGSSETLLAYCLKLT